MLPLLTGLSDLISSMIPLLSPFVDENRPSRSFAGGDLLGLSKAAIWTNYEIVSNKCLRHNATYNSTLRLPQRKTKTCRLCLR